MDTASPLPKMNAEPDAPPTPGPNVYYDEPARKSAPMLVVGPLAWLRDNLFGSVTDTILTLISLVIVVSVGVNVVTWAVADANWLVVTRNLRQFMAGNYPLDQLWRLHLTVLVIAFAIGFTAYAYARLRLRPLLIAGVLIALSAVIPPVTYAISPPVSSYFTAGTVAIQSGTVTETPLESVGFIAKAGETITVSIAAEGYFDDTLQDAAGFTDRPANALINNARNRATTEAEIAVLETSLAGDLLTDNQRAAQTARLNGLTVPPPVAESYAINRSPITVDILDGETLEVLTSATLDATISMPKDPMRFTFVTPTAGWFVMRSTVSDENGIGLLRVEGAYPLIERNFTRTSEDGVNARVLQYVRITDDFTTEARRPRVDGDMLPAAIITDYQYQGGRPFSDYMVLAGAPFLEQLSRALIPMAIAALIGIGASAAVIGVSRRRAAAPITAPDRNPKQPARSAANYLWMLALIAGATLIYGIPELDARRLALLVAQFVWVGWMYFVGIHLNRVWGRPLFYLVIVLGLAQFIIAEQISFAAATDAIPDGLSAVLNALPLAQIVGIGIWVYIGLTAARTGASRRGAWQTGAAFRGLVATTILWIGCIVLSLIIFGANANDASTDLLPRTETRGWGGLLLTGLLTLVAIAASFPLGVLLALGRRSDLPVVKAACVIYIELVRGVPLITVLFMAQLLVPLIDSRLADVDAVFRAMIGLTLFSAAYLAENVRGGLQSVPPGQEEAAKAVGLNSAQITLFITLPQALRAVLPALVGQCIALFKDTSLVALVGLTDLFGTARTTIAQPEFVGLQSEVYFFIAAIYFIVCYAMASLSRRIEFSGSGAANQRNV